uniref:(northern house mosquito) hypothetical protein n=1 Tax=Culex pipiens TaxID=7175 RepID=A0A8D8GL55_CULPI
MKTTMTSPACRLTSSPRRKRLTKTPIRTCTKFTSHRGKKRDGKSINRQRRKKRRRLNLRRSLRRLANTSRRNTGRVHLPSLVIVTRKSLQIITAAAAAASKVTHRRPRRRKVPPKGIKRTNTKVVVSGNRLVSSRAGRKAVTVRAGKSRARVLTATNITLIRKCPPVRRIRMGTKRKKARKDVRRSRMI